MSEPKLLVRLHEAIRLRAMSRKTEEAYRHWIIRFVRFHDMRHPSDLGHHEVRAFLSHLAVSENVAPSTQNQALSALLFLYRHLLGTPLPQIENIERARRTRRLPVVLTREEVGAILGHLTGVSHLVAQLLYGAGLRLGECLSLRVKDLDFDYRQIIVRQGKGDRDRRTILPYGLQGPLRAHLLLVQRTHRDDLRAGYGETMLPYPLRRKYVNAGREWGWQFVFPASQRSIDPESGVVRRYHLDESVVQRSVRAAVIQSGIVRRASCHTLRHAPAGGRLRHTHHPGTARSWRCSYHHGLYPRPQSWRTRRA